jgi:ubiquitin carboxyl-terminal hydrolase 16/45
MLEPDALHPKGSLGQELKNLFMETTYGNTGASVSLVPENLFRIMCSRNSKFQHGVTEDSNIMLLSLLDGLNDEEPGMVESLFYGQVGKNLHCKACGHATYNDGEKLDLSLAIPSKKPVSVEDCLDLYAQGNIQDWRCTACLSADGNASTNQTEQSDNGTQISVPNNNEDEHQMEQTQKVEKNICRTVASEPNQITKAPPVLILQLKRFNYDPHAPHDKTQKLGEPVIFEETLDITKFMHPRYGHIYSVQYDSLFY